MKIILLIATICTIIAVLGLVLIIAIAIGVSASKGSTAKSESGNFVIILTTPNPGEEFTNGYIDLLLSLPTGIKLEGNVLVYLDGIQKYSFKMLPTNLEISTSGLEDGEHHIVVTAKSVNNRRGIGEITVLVNDPKMMLISANYPQVIYPGMDLTISLEVSGNPAYFTVNYSSIFGETVISNSSSIQGSTLTAIENIPSNLVADEKLYTIPIVVYSTDEYTLIIPGIIIFFQLGPTNPFMIEEGVVDMRSFPSNVATNINSLNLILVENFEVSITTGQSVEIPFELDENSLASDLLVGFEGFGQHFIIPIASLQKRNSNSRRASDKTTGSQIVFVLTLPSGSIASGGHVEMLLRLQDMEGDFGQIKRITTTTSTSQTGTLHVRLTWDREADLDIHVMDPNNEEIYYGQRASDMQRGFLDLDSNGDCEIDHRKTENVYYELAISGEYIIRVDLFSACDVTNTINFVVLIEGDGCDMSQTISGSFLPSEADSGGLGSGREVLRYTTTCKQFLVSGTISYVTPMSSANPLGSIVRIVDAFGGIYGTSQVGLDATNSQRGLFSFSYEPDNIDSPLNLEFLSSNNKIDVTDHYGDTHIYRSNDVIYPNNEESAVRHVTIPLSSGSGAFNIMVTLDRMLPLYIAYGGKTSDYPWKANWEHGEYAKDTNYPISYYDENGISVGGNAMDPDEWDESVLLHEFGHLIMDITGAVITGSGSHDGSPISPNFAFSEGYATYLGQKVIGNLIYCDGWCQDLSDLSTISSLGTTAFNDGSSGDISECVVASAAFMLDFDNGLGSMMTDALTNPDKLLKKSNYDRLGTLSAVDFSDMVSIVVCSLGTNNRKSASDLLNKFKLPWIEETGFCE
ncbi:hypothetical protein LOD99_7092 [Oopsacas minuta]|uniref:Uncharacterized protein n=1 Tax=Oopsacas minuta TaxID=111878 RepID=A0AAV7JKF6_9METZ|nr:hypothetical protein LOD99_7092 [Oopsacas minuta]